MISARRHLVPGLLPALLLCGASAHAAPASAPAAASASAPAVPATHEAALAALRRGDLAAAAAGFERFAHAHPDDPLADDALARAAQLDEERLGDLERALGLYREILARYPNRRTARRAQARSTYLAALLAGGVEPAREYEEILAGFAGRPRDESVRRMAALLARHPRFPFAARGAYWIGAVERQERRPDAALEAFVRVERDWPASEWAWRARAARADILAQRGQWGAARPLYEQLAAAPDPNLCREAAAAAAHARADLWRRRSALGATALAVLGLVLLAFGAGVRREPGRLRRVPLEVWLYVPAAALLTVLVWRQRPALAPAFVEIGLVVAVALHLLAHCAHRLRAATPARGARLRRGLLLAVGVVVLVAAATYGAVYRAGQLGQVKETVAHGPERH